MKEQPPTSLEYQVPAMQPELAAAARRELVGLHAAGQSVEVMPVDPRAVETMKIDDEFEELREAA